MATHFVPMLCFSLLLSPLIAVDVFKENSNVSVMGNPITARTPKLKEVSLGDCYCKVDGPSVLCYGKECNRIPRKMSPFTLQLRVTGTAIGKLSADDFVDYRELLDLELDGNEISQIEMGTFRFMKHLANLSLSFNQLKSLEVDSFVGLENLRQLKLINNAFTRFDDVIPSLRPLKLLKQLHLSDNTFGRMDADDLIVLSDSSIETLDLANCDLRHIDPEALLPLKHIRELDLSENSIDDTNLANLLYNMKDTNMTTLDLTRMRFSGALPPRLLEVLSRSRVSQLNLQRNVLPRLTNATFPLMPALRRLDLSRCGIISIENTTFAGLTHLVSLNLASNILQDIPPAVAHLRHLKQFNFRDNSGGGTLLLHDDAYVTMSSLIMLDLSFNRIGKIDPGSFNGLVRLQELNLKNSTIYELADECFKPLGALRILNLEGNMLARQNFNAKTFEGLHSLEYLNLDNCKIINLDTGIFSPMPLLKELSLKHNFLKAFRGVEPFAGTPSLVTLDLTSNVLRRWDSRLFATSPSLRKLILTDNQISTVTSAMIEDFVSLQEVNLLENTMDCDCNLKNLSDLIVNQSSSLNRSMPLIQTDTCFSPDYWRYKPIYKFLQAINEIDCEGLGLTILEIATPNMIPFYVVIPLIVVTILIIVLSYQYRFYIHYCIFRWRVRHIKSVTVSDELAVVGKRYRYDAFVSYSNEDHSFVVRVVEMMENQSPHFKLCVFERDFTAGNVLNDCILQSITLSRKVILVISDHFVRSQWCLWELHLAQNSLLEENRDGLILIVLGKLKMSSLPPTLRFLLKTRIYLRWETDPLKQRIFWERLRSALSQKREIKSA